MSTGIVTPVFRVSYPQLFKPKINSLSKKNEFSVEALFELGADLGKLKAAAEAAGIKKFGPDKTKWPKNMRNPFRDQGEKEKDGKLPDGCKKGAIFMRFKSENQPGIVDQQVQKILDPSKLYAGCYAIANVSAFAYSQAGNSGISFGLNHVQLVKDGAPFSGRPQVEIAFSPITDSESSGSAEDMFN